MQSESCSGKTDYNRTNCTIRGLQLWFVHVWVNNWFVCNIIYSFLCIIHQLTNILYTYLFGLLCICLYFQKTKSAQVNTFYSDINFKSANTKDSHEQESEHTVGLTYASACVSVGEVILKRIRTKCAICNVPKPSLGFQFFLQTWTQWTTNENDSIGDQLPRLLFPLLWIVSGSSGVNQRGALFLLYLLSLTFWIVICITICCVIIYSYVHVPDVLWYRANICT